MWLYALIEEEDLDAKIEFIDLRNYSALKTQWGEITASNFWIAQFEVYPVFSKRALIMIALV